MRATYGLYKKKERHPFRCLPAALYSDSDSDELHQDFHRRVALSLADLDDSGVSAVTLSILRCILVEQLCSKIDFLAGLLLLCVDFGNVVKLRVDHASCMQSGGLVLLDFLLDLIKDNDLLAVTLFLDALAVGILLRDLRGDRNGLKVILFTDSQSDQRLNILSELLSSCLSVRSPGFSALRF